MLYQPRNAKGTLLSRAQVNPNVEVIIKFYWAIIQIPYTLRRYVLGVLSRYETNRLRADKMMAQKLLAGTLLVKMKYNKYEEEGKILYNTKQITLAFIVEAYVVQTFQSCKMTLRSISFPHRT